MSIRKIVRIDEDKCNGCGECVPACAEGALQIIDGKARLVSDVYCDGLGACLGHCPQDAIRIIEREADEFDEQAVAERVGHDQAEPVAASAALPSSAPTGGCPGAQAMSFAAAGGRNAVEGGGGVGSGGCPGSQARSFDLPMASGGPSPNGPPPMPPPSKTGHGEQVAAGPSHWPLQLKLIPPSAPFLRDADLLLTADCAPAAMPSFHGELLQGRPMALACPKLDDASAYVAKLAAMITGAGLRKLTIVRMEVPCCGGLVSIAKSARDAAGRGDLPIEVVNLSLRGEVIGSEAA